MDIKRNITTNITQHLKAKEITIIVGARQVGKTTLLKAIKKDLDAIGENTIFFNLDIQSHQQYFQSQQALLKKIALEFDEQSAYVFIDEIQRKENAGLFLKGLYDSELPYKFIVSGSGSLELKEKIQESLAGRKRLFEMYPVTFEEMVHFKTAYKYEEKLSAFFEIESEKATQLLHEYLNYGGYPRIVVETSVQEKRLLLDEIFSSYLEKDITSLLSLNRPDAFVLLIRLLADRVGSQISFSQLSIETGISLPTVKKYLWYAEKTFITKRVLPFFRNAKKELIKSPELFFVDLGLRNYAINQLGQIGQPYNTGMVFENFIFQLLQEKAKRYGWQVKYWRTKDKAEVDFIIDKGREQIPVEVKYQHLKNNNVSRSFRSFIDKYQPSQAFLVNLSRASEGTIEETAIKIIPYYQLLRDNLFGDNHDDSHL